MSHRSKDMTHQRPCRCNHWHLTVAALVTTVPRADTATLHVHAPWAIRESGVKDLTGAFTMTPGSQPTQPRAKQVNLHAALAQ